MQITRRNTLVGLGTIVAGGGALIGSGALSTTEAQRSISVEVLADENIALDLVDILLDTSSSQVSVDLNDADQLFPTETDINSTNYPAHESEVDNTDVSLVTNDVTIQFSGLASDTRTRFNDLFKIVNEDGGVDFTVTFEENQSSLIGDFYYADSDEASVDIDVNAGQFDTSGIVINTDGVSSDVPETDTDALVIRITEREV